MNTNEKILFCKHYFPDLVQADGTASEEDMMLAVEEFWHIVHTDPLCESLNNKIIRMIENPDSFTVADIIDLHLEDEVIEKRISEYFRYEDCCTGFSQDWLDRLQKGSDSFKRREFLRHLLFAYIIDVRRIRNIMKEAAPAFKMPEQNLKILIDIEKEDHSVNPLSMSLAVRKYHTFNLHFTIKQNQKEDIALDIKGTLNHYYWNPVLHINIPLHYPHEEGRCNLYDGLME